MKNQPADYPFDTAPQRCGRSRGISRSPLTAPRLLATLVLCAALAGCAVVPAQRPAAQLDERAACLEIFRRVDHAVAQDDLEALFRVFAPEFVVDTASGADEPGAMRQWGRHATAFVGRRHFDDPDLLERYFELKNP